MEARLCAVTYLEASHGPPTSALTIWCRIYQAEPTTSKVSFESASLPNGIQRWYPQRRTSVLTSRHPRLRHRLPPIPLRVHAAHVAKYPQESVSRAKRNRPGSLPFACYCHGGWLHGSLLLLFFDPWIFVQPTTTMRGGNRWPLDWATSWLVGGDLNETECDFRSGI
jgi:hypothetical protein